MAADEKASLEDIARAPTNLPASQAPVPAENVANLLSKSEILSEKYSALEEENRALKRAAHTGEILDSLIKPFAYATFIFMVLYCFFIGLVLYKQQSGMAAVPISDEVMKVLVGSTAVTVIGLVGMILTGIFVGARPKQ